MVAVKVAALAFFLAISGFSLLFFITSIRENERRAALISGVLTAALAASGVAFALLHGAMPRGVADGALVAFVVLSALGAAALLAPTGRNPGALRGTEAYLAGDVPPQRFDRRRTVFHRRGLEKGTEDYDRFYGGYPDLKEADDELRAKTGRVREEDSPFDSANVTNRRMGGAPRRAVRMLDEHSHPEPAGEVQDISPEELTAKVKALALHLGADDVGVAGVKPWYFYARREGGEELTAVREEHARGVVMAFEMRKEFVDGAPHSPILLETGTRYAVGTFVSVSVANFLASMGYAATANHFGHYEMLMVPPAVDAGLGELGRNGYLVSRKFGMRCRLAAVTTTAPLVTDMPVDIGVQEMCRVCVKCARTCPTRSIPFGDKTETRGVRKWQLDDRACFEFWQKVCTDCGICMRDCPYSHPAFLVHRMGAVAAKNSAVARRLLTWAEDIFYGSKPRPRVGAAWADWREP